ncbi:MAG: hypothetical protein ACRD3W_01350 [Terriglobales bacterium]
MLRFTFLRKKDRCLRATLWFKDFKLELLVIAVFLQIAATLAAFASDVQEAILVQSLSKQIAAEPKNAELYLKRGCR